MAKEVVGLIKLQVGAGSANPAPPIGPALGQRGLNIMEFCKDFNDKTKEMEKGMPIPVIITAYKDRTFTYIMKKPPVSWWIFKAAKVQKGSGTTGKDKAVAKITKSQVEQIAKEKMVDMNAKDVPGAMRMVEGSARSAGIEVVEG